MKKALLLIAVATTISNLLDFPVKQVYIRKSRIKHQVESYDSENKIRSGLITIY